MAPCSKRKTSINHQFWGSMLFFDVKKTSINIYKPSIFNMGFHVSNLLGFQVHFLGFHGVKNTHDVLCPCAALVRARRVCAKEVITGGAMFTKNGGGVKVICGDAFSFSPKPKI